MHTISDIDSWIKERGTIELLDAMIKLDGVQHVSVTAIKPDRYIILVTVVGATHSSGYMGSFDAALRDVVRKSLEWQLRHCG